MRTRVLAVAAALCIVSEWAAGGDIFAERAESARLALDSGRLAEAEALFLQAESADRSRVGEIARDMAWTHIMLGAEAVSADRMREADAHFVKADSVCSEYREHMITRWEYVRVRLAREGIRAAQADRHNADMRALLNSVTWLLEVNENNPEAHYMMGQVHELMNQEPKAVAEYRKALEAVYRKGPEETDALREEARQAAGEAIYHWTGLGTNPVWLKRDPGALQKYISGRFIVYHHGVALAKRVVKVLEYNLDLGVLSGVITADEPMPERCRVYLYADPAEMEGDVGGKAAGVETAQRGKGEKIVDTIRVCQTYMNLTQDVLPHELTHLKLAHTKMGKQTPPLWVDEGMAESSGAQKCREKRAQRILAARESGNTISMDGLFSARHLPADEAEKNLFLAESEAVVEGLVKKYGREKFVFLIWTLKTEGAEKAFDEVYGATYEDIEEVMYDWAERMTAGICDKGPG